MKNFIIFIIALFLVILITPCFAADLTKTYDIGSVSGSNKVDIKFVPGDKIFIVGGNDIMAIKNIEYNEFGKNVKWDDSNNNYINPQDGLKIYKGSILGSSGNPYWHLHIPDINPQGFTTFVPFRNDITFRNPPLVYASIGGIWATTSETSKVSGPIVFTNVSEVNVKGFVLQIMAGSPGYQTSINQIEVQFLVIGS